MSVRLSAWNDYVPTGRILMKFDIGIFVENLSGKFKFHSNRPIITGNLLEDQHTFMIISRSFLRRMRSVPDKSCGEKTHILCQIKCFSRKSYCEKNIVEPNKLQMTIWRVPTARWLPKATNTHTEYAIIFAFPRQQWLQERASMLRCT
jgi:hypothetical protein